MRAPLVDLQHLSKIYRTERLETYALSDVTLSIERGEYVAISGPSGSGKTTLLSIIGLLDVPSAGTYLLDGRPVSDLDAEERARIRNREIAFVFQSFNLINELDVYENIELPLTYRGMPAAERRERVMAAIADVDMAARAHHYPAQLSGGQQQRVAVARAMATRPLLLLADEPTGNLDSANGEAVMQLLAGLHQQGSTIVIVTHDPNYARHALRTIHLFDGRLAGHQEGALV